MRSFSIWFERGALCFSLLLALSLVSGPAFAHAPSPGLQGFWRGALHVLSDPAQGLTLIIFGLWIGQQSLNLIRRALGWFLGFSLLGIGIGVTLGPAHPALANIPTCTTALTLAAAVMVAISRPPAAALLCGAAGAAGLGLALQNIPEPGEAAALAATTLGSLVAINAAVFFLAAGLDYARETYQWTFLPLAIRIGAAWIIAITALMLALQFTTP